MRHGHATTVLTIAVFVAAGSVLRAEPPAATPEDRAVGYLGREVPLWPRNNHCYSCHNNGDAARALYVAVRLGYRLPPEALGDTNRWLARPGDWDHNGGEGPFSDKRLARVQFAAALAAGIEARQIDDRSTLDRAARRLADDQSADGSWPLDANSPLGSPATYGRALLTQSARDTLRAAGGKQYRSSISRAERWLLSQPVTNIPDASAILIAAGDSSRPDASAQRQRVFALLRKGQSQEGGWGPYADSPPEVFDTAVVLIALSRWSNPPAETRGMIARGRKFLISEQNPDGSWTETTRPAGGESYAQRVSTTGWATLALLATREKGRPPSRDPARLAPARCNDSDPVAVP